MIFDYLLGLFSSDMGIDLGTANTLVYVRGQGIVLCEPSVVAVQRGSHEVLSVGLDAKKMLGRTPGYILTLRPLKDGVIADFEVTEAMIRYFITKVHKGKKLVRPRIVISIPSGITAVERRAAKDSAEQAGARQVITVEEPMAAAIGAGLPVQEPGGNMIVDIGGGTTEVAVISLNGIVTCRTIRVGGDEMDQAIIEHLKRNYNLMIGERTAEEIKLKVGSAFPMEEEVTIEVKGRDLVAGLPKTLTISSEEVRDSLSETIHAIIDTIKLTLERTPPELSSDLVDRGVMLAGGGALLRGIDKLIAQETGLPVAIAEDPLTAIVMGTGKIVEELDTYKRVLTYSASEF